MHKNPFTTTTRSLYLTFCILLLLVVSSSPTVKGNRLSHSYKHLEGDVRWRRLFSATHYLLTIERSGQVRGTRRFNSNSIFQVYSVNVGVVTIHSAGTGLYLAMDRNGKVYGAYIGISVLSVCRSGTFLAYTINERRTCDVNIDNNQFLLANSEKLQHKLLSVKGKVITKKEYGPNCEFRERIEENGYNTYSSLRWRHNGYFMYLALRKNGLARLGSRTRHTHYSTHFLTLST